MGCLDFIKAKISTEDVQIQNFSSKWRGGVHDAAFSYLSCQRPSYIALPEHL